MITPRTEAHQRGETTYLAGRPCSKGHKGERYVSNGMCVDCLRDKAATFKNNRRQKRIDRNLHLAGQLVDFTVTVQYKHRLTNVGQDLQTLLMGSDADAVITWLHIMATVPLSKPRLATVFGWDGNKVTADYTQFPQRHDDDGILLIEIDRNWYVATEIMEVLRDQRAHAERVVQP